MSVRINMNDSRFYHRKLDFTLSKMKWAHISKGPVMFMVLLLYMALSCLPKAEGRPASIETAEPGPSPIDQTFVIAWRPATFLADGTLEKVGSVKLPVKLKFSEGLRPLGLKALVITSNIPNYGIRFYLYYDPRQTPELLQWIKRFAPSYYSFKGGWEYQVSTKIDKSKVGLRARSYTSSFLTYQSEPDMQGFFDAIKSSQSPVRSLRQWDMLFIVIANR